MNRPPGSDAPAASGGLHAWVDESITVAGDTGEGDLGGYVMAAVVADPISCNGIRDVLVDLVPQRQPRLHWKDEDVVRRGLISQTIGGLDLVAVVTVGTPVDPKKQERARRCCMERLLFELDQLGVDHVLLESRTQTLNQQDQRMIAGLRGAKAIPSRVRVDFARPSTEPMLWIADVIAGTVTALRRGNSAWNDAVRSSVDLIEVKVR